MSALVSVVVPVCNVEKYLAECLASLRKQTLKDIEFICVDDGSKDGSLRIMRRFQALDPRFKIITGPNAGYGAACNKGIDAASGKYIGILESDDFADPDFYLDLTNIAEAHRCDLVKSEFYTFGDRSKQYALSHNFDDKLYEVVFTPRGVLAKYNLFESQTCVWSAIYSRKMLNSGGIRFLETPGASYQDLAFSVKVLMRSERAYFTRRAYVYYRQTESQSIKSKGKVWCSMQEYAEIESKFPMTPELFASKYHNYMWTYNRIGIEHRYPYLKMFSQQFRRHIIEHDGIMRPHLFHPWEPAHLDMITRHPLSYHDLRLQEIYE
ncbi:MAG: glycosyltransferase, partial [Clostridiales bacterium]|nr:glycosyltransferase [Clostridiales bacterium]